MDELYSLARELKRNRSPYNGIEIGTVVKDKPLTIEIDQRRYSSKDWLFFEPEIEEKEIEGKEITLINPIEQTSYREGKEKERKAKIKYNIGDTVAIQQMESGMSFIILSKIKKVE